MHRNIFKSHLFHCVKCRCSALFTLFLLVTVLVLSSSSNVYATDDYDYDDFNWDGEPVELSLEILGNKVQEE